MATIINLAIDLEDDNKHLITVVNILNKIIGPTPAVEQQPPAVEQQPPAVEQQPPAVEQQPPAVEQQPPAVEQQPPAVDSSGIPWDERIHSSAKTRTLNGKWKKRKGVAKDLIAQVEHELMAPPVGEQQTPPVGIQWSDLLHRISTGMLNKTINANELNEFLAEKGITGGVALLSGRPDLYDEIVTRFNL